MDRRERDPSHLNHSRNRGRRRRRRRRNRSNPVISIIIGLIVLIGAGLFLGFIISNLTRESGGIVDDIVMQVRSTNEAADLRSYFGIREENELGVIIDHVVFRETENGPRGRIINGVPYLEYSLIRFHLNERFYWNAEEGRLLYSLPTGTVVVPANSQEYQDLTGSQREDFVIVMQEGERAFVAIPFVQRFTNIEFATYEEPNRVVITSEWGEQTRAEVRRNSPVRWLAGPQSSVLTEVRRGEVVTIIEPEGGWRKIVTNDGFIGYVPENMLTGETTETFSRPFEEPVWTNISRDFLINMGWHQVFNQYANAQVGEMIGRTMGLNVISPTWFSVANINGDLDSLASAEYVATAHQLGVEVWPAIRDFDGGISSFSETLELLRNSEAREHLIDQIISETLRVGATGINLDFELVGCWETGEFYIQFVRELSIQCRLHGLVLSVANHVPRPYNHYRIPEQGRIVDYVIIMGYDEFTAGSPYAGPVASYPFVREAIQTASEMVPAQRLMNAIPFYSRIWMENTTTGELSTIALYMTGARQTLENAGVTAVWDPEIRLYYAEWTVDGIRHRLWMEEERSLEEKLRLIPEFNLAGVAQWALGQEDPVVWPLILRYVQGNH